MFVGLSAVFFEIGIIQVSTVKPILSQIHDIKLQIVSTDDRELIVN